MRRRRCLALLPLVLVLAAVTTLAFFLPSLRTARATVLVNGQQIPEAYVRSSVSSGDVEARLLTLTHQILDGPRLLMALEERFGDTLPRLVFTTNPAFDPQYGGFLADLRAPVLMKPLKPGRVLELVGRTLAP